MGSKAIDETGNVYGRLTVVKRAPEKDGNMVCWVCKCSCGNMTTVRGTRLRRDETKSCGCLNKEVLSNMNRASNEVGNRYGKLIVMRREGTDHNRQATWYCECDCGGDTITTTNCLHKGSTKSCGCLGKANQFNGDSRKDATGNKYGRWTVLKYIPTDDRKTRYLCRCECGTERVVRIDHLKTGNTIGCGCYHSERVSGPNHPFWNGGVSYEDYHPSFSKPLKEKVKSLWLNRCALCGKTEEDARFMDVHHIHYNPLDEVGVRDLIPLCRGCHSKTNTNRDHWEDYLSEVVYNHQIEEVA